MGAFVNHRFSNGFILDEERIRKINETLSSRGAQIDPNCKPNYRIYREDTYSYTTINIQDILNEDNSDWQRIKGITITMEHANQFKFNLGFNAGNETFLHIEGEDRDMVFLVFSEIRQYLSNEVNVIKLDLENVSSNVITNGSYVFALVYMAWWIWNLDKSINQQNISIPYDEAVASKDLLIKLNYLLERFPPSDRTPSVISMMLPIFIVTGIVFILQYARKFIIAPIKYLYPSHLFLFGKEIIKHNKRLTLRQNLLWGVIIASLIGIVTGLIVWVITRNAG